MAARINELTQFTDDGGKPLVNGKLYIGTVGLDPVANLITIYSDRALATPLANPQTLDADGRSTNKIWIPGKYSMQVNDELAVQQVQDLDAGEDQSAGLTTVSNIQGSNTITGEGVPAITGYIDKQLYTFIVASVNTGAITVNWDTQGAKTIKRNFDLDIISGQFKANQAVIVMFNATQDIMEWVNHNNKTDYWNKGADIASAATVNLAAATGNSVVITGATGPITSFGTTPAGTIFYLTFTGTPTINHNGTSLKIPGQANVTIVAGDQVRVESLGSGNVQIQVFRQTGKALAETPVGADDITDVEIAANAVGQSEMKDSAIGQAELKTTTGDLTVADNVESTQVGAGGEFGFWPTISEGGGGTGHTVVPVVSVDKTGVALFSSNFGASLVQLFHMASNSGGGTVTMRVRYIQASPPYFLGAIQIPTFIFALIENGTGKILSMYQAADPPWANNGPTNIRPNRFDETGKAFRTVRSRKPLSNANDPNFWTDTEIEITSDYKNTDMGIIPHPFINNDLTGKTVIMIDPRMKLVERLHEIIEAGDEPLNLFHDGDINIGNNDIPAVTRPNGVMVVNATLR